MTDPDLHPLPITPNDPLSIFSSKIPAFTSVSAASNPAEPKQFTPEDVKLGVRPRGPSAGDFDIEISNSQANPDSMFEDALPSLKLKEDQRLNREQQQ